MSLANEISDLEKLVASQAESVNLSLRAMNAVFTKIAAISNFPSETNIAKYPEALKFIEGGLWKRLEALIAELESGRTAFVEKQTARINKLVGVNAPDLANEIEELFVRFLAIKQFTIPLNLNCGNFQHVLTEIQL